MHLAILNVSFFIYMIPELLVDFTDRGLKWVSILNLFPPTRIVAQYARKRSTRARPPQLVSAWQPQLGLALRVHGVSFESDLIKAITTYSSMVGTTSLSYVSIARSLHDRLSV